MRSSLLFLLCGILVAFGLDKLYIELFGGYT